MNISQKLKQSFLCFSLFFGIVAISFFIAYNWSLLTNIMKISIPFSLFLLFGSLWFVFQQKEFYRQLSLFSASFFIGSIFAVFGQVYQTGADPYRLFLTWGIFLFIFTYVELFYPIFILQITVFSISIFLYTRLYYRTEIAFFATGFFLFFLLTLYLFLQQKKNFPIKYYFLYLLTIFSTLFLTIGGITSDTFVYTVSPIAFLLLFLLGKYFKQKTIEIFAVLSLPFLLTSVLLRIPDFVIASFLSLLIFAGTLYLIIKYYQNSFFIHSVTIFLKFSLFIVLLSFIGAVSFYLFKSSHIFPFLSVLLFGASIIIPQKFSWKKDKTEIVSFITGHLILLTYIAWEWKVSILSIIFLSFAMFLVFYWKFYSRAFDFMLAPLLIIYFILLTLTTSFHNATFLYVYLLILFIDILHKNRTEREERILLGVKISTLFLFSTSVAKASIFLFSKTLTSLLIAGLILTVLYQIFWKNQKSYFCMLSILFLFLLYETTLFPGIGLGIVFFLDSLWNNKKYFLLCSILFLGSEVFFYYYTLNFSLFTTSQSMGKLCLIFFLAFLVLQKGGSHEKNISSL